MQAASGSASLGGITPIVPVRRVARAIAFYTEVLGFELRDRNHEATFAYLSRGEAGIMLLDLDDPRAVHATASFFSAYIWVPDIATFYMEVKPMLDRLPEGRMHPLFTRVDGRREFHVRDPDGFLLFFGEAIETPVLAGAGAGSQAETG